MAKKNTFKVQLTYPNLFSCNMKIASDLDFDYSRSFLIKEIDTLCCTQ